MQVTRNPFMYLVNLKYPFILSLLSLFHQVTWLQASRKFVGYQLFPHLKGIAVVMLFRVSYFLTFNCLNQVDFFWTLYSVTYTLYIHKICIIFRIIINIIINILHTYCTTNTFIFRYTFIWSYVTLIQTT